VVVGPKADVSGISARVVVQEPLEASDIQYRHDRHLLREALEKAIQALG
jgi:broad specificity polyphosphatase/5'/3'-nucleotidase SurE